MDNIEIVQMSLEHIDDVMVVEHLSFTIPWSKDSFVEEVTRNKFARYIVAKAGQKVVGYAGLWKVCDEGHVTNIAVHPEFRGCGIGDMLLKKLIVMAQAEGVAAMTLEVRAGNAVAQNLYIKCGFRAEGIRRSYYADNGEDAIIMWKYFS